MRLLRLNSIKFPEDDDNTYLNPQGVPKEVCRDNLIDPRIRHCLELSHFE